MIEDTCSEASEEEPIQEGDHQSRIQREFKDRLKKYKKEELGAFRFVPMLKEKEK